MLQIGRGALEPAPRRGAALALDVFRFKESLAEELRRADLVISHAGRPAGPRAACLVLSGEVNRGREMCACLVWDVEVPS